MKHLLTLFFIFCSLFSIGQNPLVKVWDARFGGDAEEQLYSIKPAFDGGYILAGISRSGISGDKSQPVWGVNGDTDYWIVKTDSLGIKQWDKDFGGQDFDVLYSVHTTSDGGYILGGYSESGINGNKTQPTWGSYDYWIVKTDSLGNKQWDKDFGWLSFDALCSVWQTTDGGYILGGNSWSDVGGDKSQPLWGLADYWIVKTDSLGNKQWDKDFGGSEEDFFSSIQQTFDGGYILGGYSYSGISGDKTQPTWGQADYWIVKLDSLGNKQWDKNFGGSDEDILFSIQQTFDGGYILGGISKSGISGDKTQNIWGNWDYWVIKTDNLGNKQWDKDFGGTGDDESSSVVQTLDGGYLISGDSYTANISGNKTESNLGLEQTWVVKTDSLGTVLWDKTVFTPGHDDNSMAIQIQGGCYVMANQSDGGIGGYKSQPAWNNGWDYWIVKFCETLQSGFTSPSSICPGTCVDFTNLSFNASSYQWNFFGASPDTSTALDPQNICYATPGTYDVQLIASNPASGGSDTLLLTNYITVYPFPPPQSITQSGDTLFAIAGSASYQWYFNTTIINGATDYFYVAQASGDYNVVATDANGCEVEAAVFNVVASVNTSEDQEILIFPNPVGDKFTIQKSHPDRYRDTRETATEISIYNCLGEVVLAVPLQTSNCLLRTCSIDAHSLSPGLYYLEIKTSEKTFRRKFLKSTYR